MRGKASPRPKVEPLRGITPAYAGKSAGMHAGMAAVGDHPRVCGEKLFIGFLPTFHPGSPPRVRGKAKNATLGGGKRGITPRVRGKAASDALSARYQQDHPRVCGEKFAQDVQQDYQIGSPPRVRGKAVRGRKRHSRGGITPACAGKSLHKSTGLILARDHPRVCGEKSSAVVSPCPAVGSPPRVRGKAACSSSSVS